MVQLEKDDWGPPVLMAKVNIMGIPDTKFIVYGFTSVRACKLEFCTRAVGCHTVNVAAQFSNRPRVRKNSVFQENVSFFFYYYLSPQGAFRTVEFTLLVAQLRQLILIFGDGLGGKLARRVMTRADCHGVSFLFHHRIEVSRIRLLQTQAKGYVSLLLDAVQVLILDEIINCQ